MRGDLHLIAVMREVLNHIITLKREDIIKILFQINQGINTTVEKEEIALPLNYKEKIILKESVGRDKDQESTKHQCEIKSMVVTKTEAIAKIIEVLINVQLAQFLLVPSDSLLLILSF